MTSLRSRSNRIQNSCSLVVRKWFLRSFIWEVRNIVFRSHLITSRENIFFGMGWSWIEIRNLDCLREICYSGFRFTNSHPTIEKLRLIGVQLPAYDYHATPLLLLNLRHFLHRLGSLPRGRWIQCLYRRHRSLFMIRLFSFLLIPLDTLPNHICSRVKRWIRLNFLN